MPTIKTWRDIVGEDSDFSIRERIRTTWGRYHPNEHWVDSAVEGTVAAYINHGRWIAECPHGCGYAIQPDLLDPVFLCAKCGFGWVEVEFPKNRKRIEDELLKRPEVNQNWRGESMRELRKETKVGMDNARNG